MLAEEPNEPNCPEEPDAPEPINNQLESMLKDNIRKTLKNMESEDCRPQSRLFDAIENLKIFYESLEAKEKYLHLESQRKQMI